MAKPIVAIMYDFDKTLSTTDMQNYDFIPKLGMTPKEFWSATGEFSKKTGVERILSYMYTMIFEAKKRGIKLTRKYLQECGKNIEYYPGVKTWFKRINEIGESVGVKVEHYLVSSGTMEIIEGSEIFHNFTKAWGCEFYYQNDEPVWPKLAINYTQKTQFFFRISKGVTDTQKDDEVNEKKVERRIPYTNMVYIGDGMTDIPCMTLVNKNHGTSMAVYPKGDHKKASQIREDGRVKFVCEADYSANGPIEKVLKLFIQSVAIKNEIDKKEQQLAKLTLKANQRPEQVEEEIVEE